MSKTFKLKIISPDGLLLDREVESLTVPTTSGEITILANHIPLMTQLAHGEMLATVGDEQLPIAVAGGFLKIENNEVDVLADYALAAEHVTEEKLEQAMKRADEIRAMKDTISHEQFEAFEGELERALALSKIHGKYKDKTYKKLSI